MSAAMIKWRVRQRALGDILKRSGLYHSTKYFKSVRGGIFQSAY